MTDERPDDLLDAKAVGEICSVDGKPRSEHAVWRWARVGVKVGDTRVKLEATQLPGRKAFRRSDVDAFLKQLNAGGANSLGIAEVTSGGAIAPHSSRAQDPGAGDQDQGSRTDG